MNFLNMMANRLTEKFDPNSAGFGGSGILGNMSRGDGGMAGRIMQPGADDMSGPGIENADASRAQEQQARNRGFRSYQQMLDWARQRNQVRQPQTVSRGAAPDGGASPGSSSMQNGMLIHPKNMLEWITDKFNGATGQ